MSSELTYTINEVDPCRKAIEVISPAAQIKTLTNNILQQLGGQVKLPGFRDGKAPKTVLLQKYAKEIKNDLREKLVQSAVQKATEKENYELAGYMDVSEFEPKQNEDCKFTVTIDIYPDVTLPDYKSFKVETAEYKEDEAAVTEALDQTAARFGTLQVVERPAAKDDFVKVNFSSNIENEAAQEVLGGEDRWIPLIDDCFIPGAEAALIGKSAGDKVEWTATFKEDFHIADLAGKEVEYKAALLEVHGRDIPALDDELAVKAGAKDLAELTEKTKEQLKGAFENELRGKQRDEIVDQLLEGLEFDLPTYLFQEEVNRQVHTIKAEEGIAPKEDDCCSDDTCNNSQSEDCDGDSALTQKAESQAAKDLKTRVLLRKIAKEEKVELTEYEVQMQLYSMAQHYQMPVQDLVKQLRQTNSLNEFTDHVLIDKTLDKLVDLVNGK